jgi:hypothetical protein
VLRIGLGEVVLFDVLDDAYHGENLTRRDAIRTRHNAPNHALSQRTRLGPVATGEPLIEDDDVGSIRGVRLVEDPSLQQPDSQRIEVFGAHPRLVRGKDRLSGLWHVVLGEDDA